MARRRNDSHREWARLGAHARLQQLDDERRAIFAAFPELRRGAAAAAPGPAAAPAGPGRRRRRRMSAEARKRMSAGMKRYWAQRRAADQKTGKSSRTKDKG